MSVQKQAQVPEIDGSVGSRSPRKRWWKRARNASIHLSRDFQAHTLAIQETPPSPFTRMVLWGLALLVIVLLTWSYVSHIPIMTSAPGKFVTSARTKVIQSLDTGTVSAILVKTGDIVKTGQTLVELSPEVDQSALVSRTHAMALDQLEEQRIQAEISGKAEMAPVSGETASMVSLESRLQQSELSHYQAQLADDQAQIQEAQANLAAGQATLDEYAQRAVLDRRSATEAAPLVSQGALSGYHYDQLQDTALKEEGKLATQKKQVVQLQQALVAAQEKYAKDRTDFSKKLYKDWQDTQSQVYDLSRKASAAKEQYHLNWLRSPVDGVVQGVDVASLGTVIQQGQTVATVVPLHAPLTVGADISSQNVGFIKVGQQVEIKVSAFPFEQYGMISGVVTSISPTAEASNTVAAPPPGESHQSQAAASPTAPQAQDGEPSSSESAPPTLYYRVHVQPKQNWLLVDGVRHPMSAGMTVTVDVRTGRRRVLDFFLDPVIKYLNNGLQLR